MIERLRAQIVKELLSYLRDPKSRVTLIGPPLMQLFIFSFAATLTVQNIDIAVLDEDTGRWSYEFVERIRSSDFVDDIKFVSSSAELERLIDQRKVLAAVHFGADFSRNLTSRRTATAQVLIDGRRANSGQITLSYLDAIAQELGAELARNNLSSRSVVRHWFNPNLTYHWFIVPGLTGILAMFISLIVTALSIAREREMGTFDQLMVSPATPVEIVVGKSVPAVMIGTFLGMVMIVAAAFFFRVPFTGSLSLLLLSLVLFILSVVGVGLMISALCQTQQQAILGAFAVAVPVILISGFATPVENMPGWLQIVAQASPLKHFLIIVQGSFVKALPMREVISNAWPMLLIAIVTLSLAVVLVKRNLQ